MGKICGKTHRKRLIYKGKTGLEDEISGMIAERKKEAIKSGSSGLSADRVKPHSLSLDGERK